jgi:hypothetical protein
VLFSVVSSKAERFPVRHRPPRHKGFPLGLTNRIMKVNAQPLLILARSGSEPPTRLGRTSRNLRNKDDRMPFYTHASNRCRSTVHIHNRIIYTTRVTLKLCITPFRRILTSETTSATGILVQRRSLYLY